MARYIYTKKKIHQRHQTHLQTHQAPAGIGREVLVWWDWDCSRKMSGAPHLPVESASNSPDPGAARLGQEAKRVARWLMQPIGDEIEH